MNRILLIPNPNLCDLDKAVKDVTSYFEDFEVFIDPLETDMAYKCLDEKMNNFDVVVTLGGDGSMLKVVELVYKHGLSMFGINYGGLGYLTSLKKNELDVLRNKTYIEERSVLEVSIPTLNYKRIALNDAVIFKTNINVPIKLSVDDGSDVCEHFADGLIVATSTGSTAYSYSAGGPVIEEGKLILTPISPVLRRSTYKIYNDDVSFKINSIRDNRDKAYISIDGSDQIEIDRDNTVFVKKAPKCLKIVRFEYD